MRTETVTVRWVTTEVTTYQAEIPADEWAEMQSAGTTLDDLAEYQSAETERRYENDREIEENA